MIKQCSASFVLLIVWCFSTGSSWAQTPSTSSDALTLATEIVELQRQAIALHEQPAGLSADAAQRLGHYLFHQGRSRTRDLGELLNAEARAAISATPSGLKPQLNAFLDALERPEPWLEIDKLALRGVLDGVDDGLASGTPALARTTALLARLKAIRARYSAELSAALSENTRSAPARRNEWQAYVVFLKERYPVASIIDQYRFVVEFDQLRGKKAESGKPAPDAKPAMEGEWLGTNLPPKTLLLTFDDGPHPKYTTQILDILDRYKIKAIFFQVGQNLGSATDVNVTRNAAIVADIKARGHAIANHSYTHAFLPKLDESHLAAEIDRTQKLVEAAAGESPAKTRMFRAPYGARNPAVMAELSERGLRSVMWNIDSKDWADPVPSSIAQRVVGEVDAQGRGIILFHDIHGRTVEALPLVLEQLTKKGYQFASWDGAQLVVNAQSITPTREPLYRESHAVVIGIDDYAAWPRLRYAANDAKAMRETLINRLGFKAENITLLLNKDATREAILSALGDRLGDSKKVKRDDRVFVFFAGHGATRRLPSGRDLGYIIPVDADQENFQGKAISMTQFQDISEAIPAKHVLFVMDACYAGLALTRGASSGSAGLGNTGNTSFLREVTRRQARQMFTAGGADEQVADNGPNGHSIFTWTLLQGLEGKADLNGDGVITASELAAHVAPIVSTLSKQTPTFGNLVGSEGGEMVFEIGHQSEFLSSQSRQLDNEAGKLSAQIVALKADISAKAARNIGLREELLALQNQGRNVPLVAPPGPAAAPVAGVVLPPTEARAAAIAANDRGTAWFRDRLYAEALGEFEAAVKFDANYTLAVNNLGFTLYRLNRFAESVTWFEKTLAQDPNRAVAALNLGDALAKLSKNEEAVRAYRRYLELQPQGRAADNVREQIRLFAK